MTFSLNRTTFLLVIAIIASPLIMACSTVATTGDHPASSSNTFNQRISESPAPEGFSWHLVEELSMGVLVPDGWHVQKQQSRGTTAVFVTLEKISPGSNFRTGVNIQAIRKAPSKAAALLEIPRTVCDKHGLEARRSKDGVFILTSCQVTTEASDPVRIFMLGLANTKTDTGYLVTLECPESDCQSQWSRGTKIVSELMIDSRL